MGGAWLLAAAAFAVAGLAGPDLAGFAREDVALALFFGSLALAGTGWAAGRARAGFDAGAAAIVLWAAGLAALSGAFVHRGEWSEVSAGLGFASVEPVVVEGGAVAVPRRPDGHFAVPGRVNAHDVSFIFDTGASTVVISAETARRIGIPPESLRYRVPVATANGRALAAPVTLDTLSVGPIVVRRVAALVTQPGLLDGNLLGQTFLDRLESYEVRGRRLVMKAGKNG